MTQNLGSNHAILTAKVSVHYCESSPHEQAASVETAEAAAPRERPFPLREPPCR